MHLKKTDLYFFGLAIMAIGLPVSEFLMSISFIILALAWLVNGPKRIQWNAVVKNKLVWSGLILFLIPLVSLLWTENYSFSFNDLRIKLPLLLIPFFIASYELKEKNFFILLALLIGSTFVGSIILFINYHYFMDGKLQDLREISIFISHIRYSLIIDICIYILIYAAIKWRNKYSIIAILMALWFIYFIFFLGSGNGFIGLLLILVFGIALLLFKSPYRILSYTIAILFLAFSTYILYLSNISYRSHFIAKEEAYNSDNQEIKKGKDYFSLLNDKQLENGYYIWRNISTTELEEEWKAVCDPEFLYKDARGQDIEGPLTRYLTSKALSKDASGIHQLSKQDIENIQMGNYNYQQPNWNNLQLRIDQIFYQLMAHYNRNDPNNKPLLQRLYYWRGAIDIISSHPILGVGSGDIQVEFDRYFEREVKELKPQYWHHTHNQYLTYFVISGVFGFLAFLWAVFYPLSIYLKRNSILALAQIVLLISFLSEDTLETQAGITLYVLFLALGISLFNEKDEKLKIEDQ